MPCRSLLAALTSSAALDSSRTDAVAVPVEAGPVAGVADPDRGGTGRAGCVAVGVVHTAATTGAAKGAAAATVLVAVRVFVVVLVAVLVLVTAFAALVTVCVDGARVVVADDRVSISGAASALTASTG
ncbi:hypothetical protein [Nostocoides australiense]